MYRKIADMYNRKIADIFKCIKEELLGWTKVVGENFGALLFYALLFSMPAYVFRRYDSSIGFYEHGLLLAFFTSLLPASIFMLTRALCLDFNNRFGKYCAGFTTSAAVFISVFDLWMKLYLRSRWSDRIIRLIYETNGTEASEFLSSSFFSKESLLTLLIILGAAGTFYLIFIKLYRFLYLKTGPASRTRLNILFLLLWLAGMGRGICLASGIESKISNNSIFQFSDSVSAFKENFAYVKILEQACGEADGRMIQNADHPSRIIWIIGESDAVAHNELYGYPKKTNPEVAEENSKGNIVVFEDVICHTPMTSVMMDYIYSPAPPEVSKMERAKIPMVTGILRKAGYSVRLFDNQQTLMKGDDPFELGTCNFMNSRILNAANFDFRNDTILNFDCDFLKRYESQLRSARPLTLDIIHLKGQHDDVAGRIPDKQKYSCFSENDYSDIPGVTPSRARQLAAMDNTTRYIDEIIGNLFKTIENEDAVVIYMSDHGELHCEIDERHSRSNWNVEDFSTLDYFLKIPFYVYTTPKFRALHPGLYERIKKGADRKFSTIYFSHFLMNMAGVSSRYLDDSRSPLSEKWASPPRLIEGNRNYDEWIQDKNFRVRKR